MAEGVRVVITGIDELNTSLTRFAKDLESNPELNKKLSSVLAQKSSAIAPRLSGALASSIVGNGSGERARIVAGSPTVPYAGVIEYGWPQKGREARPYLTTAVNKNLDYVVSEYNRDIEQTIKKYNLN
jgi:hypothetical protein